MPFDIFSIFEGLGVAGQLLPTNYERKYRDLAHETILELLAVLVELTRQDPLHIGPGELKRFKDAKANLVKLITNPPEPDFPLHEAMKPILTRVLETSRAFSAGAVNKEQVALLAEQLRDHLVKHKDV